MTSTGQRAPILSRASRLRLYPALFVLFLAAVTLRLWAIGYGLPALYRPDEDVVVGRAMGILQGTIDPHFADYPHFYFYVSAAWLAPAHWVGLVSSQASGYLGVRILDAVLGSLTVLLVFEFGRRAYGMLAGIFAAVALAVAFLPVRDSHFATLDIPMTFACTAGLFVAYRTLSARGWKPLILNGILLGVAASLKYNGALVASGMTAAQVLRGRMQETPPLRVLGRLIAIAVVGISTLVITSPFLLLEPGITARALPYVFQHLANSTAPAPGWVELGKALWYGLDPVLAVLLVLGVGYAAWRRDPVDWILLSFVIVYFVLIGSGGTVYFRYANPTIPALLLLAGRALAALVDQLASSRPRWLAIAAASVVIVAPSLVHDVAYTNLIEQTDTRTLAYDWLVSHVPVGGRAAVPYYSGAAHDQAMVDSGHHSHGATTAYVKSFLYNRLETTYSTVELSPGDLQAASVESLQAEGVQYLVVSYDAPGAGCRVSSPLERRLAQDGPPVAAFSPTIGCPSSTFDPIDSYYVPFAGYGGWLRPGPWIRIYRVSS